MIVVKVGRLIGKVGDVRGLAVTTVGQVLVYGLSTSRLERLGVSLFGLALYREVTVP